jgi:hypothetical protein
MSAYAKTQLRGNCHTKLLATTTGATKGYMLPPGLAQRSFSTTPACKSNTVRGRERAVRIEAIKLEIGCINADSTLSKEDKYRNSERAFAHIDSIKLMKKDTTLAIELRGVARALEQPAVLERFKKGLPDPDLTRVADLFRARRIANRNLYANQWKVFKMTMFAPWVDLTLWSRLSVLPYYFVQGAGRRVLLALDLRRGERKYARWLSRGAQ